jgi:hypothetical protein
MYCYERAERHDAARNEQSSGQPRVPLEREPGENQQEKSARPEMRHAPRACGETLGLCLEARAALLVDGAYGRPRCCHFDAAGLSRFTTRL